MNKNFLEMISNALEPMGNVMRNEVEHKHEQIITFSKENVIFAIIYDNNLYLRNRDMFDSVDTHYVYQNRCYTIMDVAGVQKSTEKKDTLLRHATNSYWIATKRK